MSEENVEVARQGYRDFNTGGLPALRRYLRDDVVWETPQEVPEAGIYRGIEAVMAYVQSIVAPFEELRMNPIDFISAGKEQVLVVLRVQATVGASEAWVEMPSWHLWTVRGRKGSAVRMFLDEAEALKAAGLSE